MLRSTAGTKLSKSTSLLRFGPFVFRVPPSPQSSQVSVPPIAPRRLQVLTRSVPACAQLSMFFSALIKNLQYNRLYNLRVESVSLSGRALRIQRSIGQNGASENAIRCNGAGARSDIEGIRVPSTVVPVLQRRLYSCYSVSAPSSPMFIPGQSGVVSRAALRHRFTGTQVGTGQPSLAFRKLHTDRTALLVLRKKALHRIVGRLKRIDRGITIECCRLAITRRRDRVMSALTQSFVFRDDEWGELCGRVMLSSPSAFRERFVWYAAPSNGRTMYKSVNIGWLFPRSTTARGYGRIIFQYRAGISVRELV